MLIASSGTPGSWKSYSPRTYMTGPEPRKAMTTLGDLMTRDVVTVGGTTSAEYVRELMVQHQISRVVIVADALSPVGILTDRDILEHTLAGGFKDLADVVVHQVMSRLVVREPESTTAPQCARRMLDDAVSSVVVVHGGTMAGIVTKTDLCGFYAVSGGEKERVRERMTPRPVTLTASRPLRDAASIMLRSRISKIPIVNGRLEGMITLSDITVLNRALNPDAPTYESEALVIRGRVFQPIEVPSIKIGDVMTRDPVTTSREAYLREAARSMMTHHVSALPVLSEGGALEGILTKTDVTKAVASMT
jgi:CBS domain-containing protein